MIILMLVINLETIQTREIVGSQNKFMAQVTYGKNEMVKIKLKGRDEQYQTTSLTASNITVKLDGKIVNPTTKTVTSTTNVTGGVDALICLGGFSSTGKLSITLSAGTLTDSAGNKNTETTLDTMSNIGDIYIGVADANATSADILRGKTAYKGTTLLTGTIENFSGQTKVSSTIEESEGNALITIPNVGYYDRNSKISVPVEIIKKQLPTLSSGVYYLGTGVSFDVKSKFPNDYNSFSTNNFIVSAYNGNYVATSTISGYTVGSGAKASGFSIGCSYNASNGILTLTGNSQEIGSVGNGPNHREVMQNIGCKAYLVIGQIQ